jgi:hypothetical protein
MNRFPPYRCAVSATLIELSTAGYPRSWCAGSWLRQTAILRLLAYLSVYERGGVIAGGRGVGGSEYHGSSVVSIKHGFLFLSQYVVTFNCVSSDMHIHALFAISHT